MRVVCGSIDQRFDQQRHIGDCDIEVPVHIAQNDRFRDNNIRYRKLLNPMVARIAYVNDIHWPRRHSVGAIELAHC